MEEWYRNKKVNKCRQARVSPNRDRYTLFMILVLLHNNYCFRFLLPAYDYGLPIFKPFVHSVPRRRQELESLHEL